MQAQAFVERVTGDPSIAEVAVMRFRDDVRYRVETVDGTTPPLPRSSKWIINVSTQFGCPVGCPICDAGWEYHGNLSTDEIIAQIEWALSRYPGLAGICAKLKVHFSRMGEPALNDSVLNVIERLPEIVGSNNLWCCVATTAPRGRESWFENLIELKRKRFHGRFQLQFSMQTTDAHFRARLIPIERLDDLEICEYGHRFFEYGDRKVVLNYALAQDVPFEPGKIISTFDPVVFAIKLTPVNPTARAMAEGYTSRLRNGDIPAGAVEALRMAGFDVILSVGDNREDTIRSNCGQVVAIV